MGLLWSKRVSRSSTRLTKRERNSNCLNCHACRGNMTATSLGQHGAWGRTLWRDILVPSTCRCSCMYTTVCEPVTLHVESRQAAIAHCSVLPVI